MDVCVRTRTYVEAFMRLKPRLTQLKFKIFMRNQLLANAEFEMIKLNSFSQSKFWWSYN